MTIDLSDPAIASTYNQILRGEEKDWLILTYTKARDALHLADSGTGGPDGLRDHLKPHSNDVAFGLVRIGGPNRLFLGLTHALTKARAIVHERALGDMFPARRAVLNVSSEAEVTMSALERVSHTSPLPARQPAPASHHRTTATLPVSPPRSSEESRLTRALPPPPAPAPAQPRERGLPLNLPEPLDVERQREINKEQQEELTREQRATASHLLAPNGGGNAATRTSSPKPGKPQLSVAVPPRRERGLQPMKYDGYEYEDEEDDNDIGQDEELDDDSPKQENIVLRTHSRPSSRGPTPPPGPSILRHPSPIPPRPDSGTSVPSGSHIRFTGPPKDHPHPSHHPLKPNDQVSPTATSNKVLSQTTDLSRGPTTSQATMSSRPTPGTSAFQRTASTSSKPEEAAIATAVSDSTVPPIVASSSLHSSITWQSASQPNQPISSLNTNSPFNSPRPSQSLKSTSDNMAPTTPANGLSNRSLPPQPFSTFSTRSGASNASESVAHSRNPSVPTTAGQTHVPSGTLCAFGRRTSVSSVQQNGGANPSPALLAQMNLSSPTSLLDRSSTSASATTSSSASTTAYRPMPVQTHGMTEAQLQAARSRAKWAAEEQGIVIAPQPVPNSSLPRSPPLTPPTSPPRSLSVEEAGRVRRDGAEKMRREAERRREEDEKKKSAEEKRKAEAELQMKMEKEREVREEKERVEQAERRKETELKKRAMEEEQSKRRAEEKVRLRERFQQVRGTDEVFLTGHVNVQPESAMTWKWRFYELTAGGRLCLYKSSDAPDRIRPLDSIAVKDAVSINRSADELELISFAFRLEFSRNKESWSFYSDSQYDMDILTEGITWTMGL